jgi:hypothetical protein
MANKCNGTRDAMAIRFSFSRGAAVTIPLLIARAEGCPCSASAAVGDAVAGNDWVELTRAAAELAIRLANRHGINPEHVEFERDGSDLIVNIW